MKKNTHFKVVVKSYKSEKYKEDICNIYDKKAKNYNKDGNLDTETFDKLKIDLTDTLKKYKTVLANILQCDINAIKEDINRERLEE